LGSANTNRSCHECLFRQTQKGKEMKWRNRKRRQFIADLPSEACTISRRVWRGYWQVFGLAGVPDRQDRGFYWPIFPVSEKTSGLGVFDPAYRCGAVPDSNRVPSNVPLGTSPANEPQDIALLSACQPKCCGFVVMAMTKVRLPAPQTLFKRDRSLGLARAIARLRLRSFPCAAGSRLPDRDRFFPS
jgi:hypothetical protein